MSERISINPDRLLSVSEVKDLIYKNIIPRDCRDTKSKRIIKRIKSLLGMKKENRIDYHIIILRYDDFSYYDIKILPDLYDAMMYCDRLSNYNGFGVFLYSITGGKGRSLTELNIKFSERKLMHLFSVYGLWRKSRAAGLVETFKRDEVLLRARLKELPETIHDWKRMYI